MKIHQAALVISVLPVVLALAQPTSESNRLTSRTVEHEESLERRGQRPVDEVQREALLQQTLHSMREGRQQRERMSRQGRHVPSAEQRVPRPLTAANLREHQHNSAAQGRPLPGLWRSLWVQLRDDIADLRWRQNHGDLSWITQGLPKVDRTARMYERACRQPDWTPDHVLAVVRREHAVTSQHDLAVLEAVHRVIDRPSFDPYDLLMSIAQIR